jgi:hypothetical protein
MIEPESLPVFDHAQRLPPFGFQLPTRMSVLVYASGKLALVSPVPIDDEVARKLAVLGDVHYLIAPNLLHHAYLAAATTRYPMAKVLGPSALRKKRPDLTLHATLDAGLPAELTQVVEMVHIDGAPAVDEYVFFHSRTRTLVVTDLVFNLVRPRGWFTHLVLFLVGCHRRLGQSRTWRLFVRDRAAASVSFQRVLALPFDTLVMAHGEVVKLDARAKLARALAWLLPSGPTLDLAADHQDDSSALRN